MPHETAPPSLSLFFFQSSGDHRDLHSFPTRRSSDLGQPEHRVLGPALDEPERDQADQDRKSTRLNASHPSNPYAVFCLKQKTHQTLHNLSTNNLPKLPTTNQIHNRRELNSRPQPTNT